MQSAKTQPFAPEPSSPDDLLETGLPNLWYLIARSEDVDVRPVALKRLDRKHCALARRKGAKSMSLRTIARIAARRCQWAK